MLVGGGPTQYVIFVVRGNSSVGRAQPCQGWGRGFESRFPLRFSSGSESHFRCSRTGFTLAIGLARRSARVAKPVDARDLKSLGTNSHAGSIPAPSIRQSRLLRLVPF